MPKVVDPLGGSYYVETLTPAWSTRREADRGGRGAGRHDQGGRIRHAQAAHRGSRRRAARPAIDRGEEIIVGVNKFQSRTCPVDVLDIDNDQVREQQIDAPEQIRRPATARQCVAALQALARGGARR